MKTIVVDINGTPHIVDNISLLSHLAVLASQSGNRFMVLSSNEGNLFNPTDPQDRIDKPDKERGGKFYRLRSCSQLCYTQYGAFLRSKNRTHYILAQRRFSSDFV